MKNLLMSVAALALISFASTPALAAATHANPPPSTGAVGPAATGTPAQAEAKKDGSKDAKKDAKSAKKPETKAQSKAPAAK